MTQKHSQSTQIRVQMSKPSSNIRPVFCRKPPFTENIIFDDGEKKRGWELAIPTWIWTKMSPLLLDMTEEPVNLLLLMGQLTLVEASRLPSLPILSAPGSPPQELLGVPESNSCSFSHPTETSNDPWHGVHVSNETTVPKSTWDKEALAEVKACTYKLSVAWLPNSLAVLVPSVLSKQFSLAHTLPHQ